MNERVGGTINRCCAVLSPTSDVSLSCSSLLFSRLVGCRSYMLGLVQLSATIFCLIWYWLSQRIGKKAVFLVGAASLIVVLSVLYFVKPGQLALCFILTAAAGIGLSAIQMLPLAMLPDSLHVCACACIHLATSAVASLHYPSPSSPPFPHPSPPSPPPTHTTYLRSGLLAHLVWPVCHWGFPWDVGQPLTRTNIDAGCGAKVSSTASLPSFRRLPRR